MPRPLPVLPMEVDQFQVMSHRLGWKHEYWDGAARLSPSCLAVAQLEIETAKAAASGAALRVGDAVRTVTPEDEAALVELHLAAFEDSTEFAGYSEDAFRKETQQSLAGYFGVRPSWRRRRGLIEHSYLVERSGRLVAALLTVQEAEGPVVEPVMVEPSHQQRGLGTALLIAALAGLRDAGVATLRSRCHLANTASLEWHARKGFRETPDHFAASCRRHHYAWQVGHFEAAGDPERAALMQQYADHWARVMDATEPGAGRRVSLPLPGELDWVSPTAQESGHAGSSPTAESR